MSLTLSSVTVVPPAEPTKIRSEHPPRRKSSFSGEYIEYTNALSLLQDNIVIVKQTIKNIRPSHLDAAKKILTNGKENTSSFAAKLEEMRATEQLLSSDPTKTTLAGHFQTQLKTLIVSTEEHLVEYQKALSELDRNIRLSLLADDEKTHPPLVRQKTLSTLKPISTWQKFCAFFKKTRP